MSQTIALDQLPPELLQIIEAYKSGTAGTRSPVRTQLKDLRDPMNPKAKLHRPSFSWSADADPEAPPYQHQAFPKLMFHARQGEIVVMNEEALSALGPDWKDAPITIAKVSPADAVRAEIDSLSPEDRELFLSMQREARMKRIQALMGELTDAELAAVVQATPDAAPKRGPGRPPKSHGDGA